MRQSCVAIVASSWASFDVADTDYPSHSDDVRCYPLGANSSLIQFGELRVFDGSWISGPAAPGNLIVWYALYLDRELVHESDNMLTTPTPTWMRFGFATGSRFTSAGTTSPTRRWPSPRKKAPGVGSRVCTASWAGQKL